MATAMIRMQSALSPVDPLAISCAPQFLHERREPWSEGGKDIHRFIQPAECVSACGPCCIMSAWRGSVLAAVPFSTASLLTAAHTGSPCRAYQVRHKELCGSGDKKDVLKVLVQGWQCLAKVLGSDDVDEIDWHSTDQEPTLHNSSEAPPVSLICQDLLAFLSERPHAVGIIYARLRATCDWLAGALGDAGVDVQAYHAGKDAAQRAKVSERARMGANGMATAWKSRNGCRDTQGLGA